MNNTRVCPGCGKELFYNLLENYESAEKLERSCKKCVKCAHRTDGTFCIKCSHRTKAYKIKSSLALKGKKRTPEQCRNIAVGHKKGQYDGDKNFMFGKTPYDIWLKKYGKEEADRRHTAWKKKMAHPWAHDLERVAKQREVARNAHPGRSNYSLWLEKYGPEEANRRMKDWSDKARIASSGSNNPMFGRPSPVGSGTGWSGWYQGHYFHSLLELTYMLLLDKKGTTWETGEQKRLATTYEWAGKTRNYFPDFSVGSAVVELKPKRLVNLGQNQAKFAAARARWGDNFKVITEEDIVKIQGEELKTLCASGAVVLLDKWKARL